ncbi:MAG: type IV pilin biogenesis protein, partial [Myxococcales bacterium]|nr:type IV pilin biogenesis protein [Myxococcales bacterium]
YKADADIHNTKCWWANCEDENAGMLQSRIHAARQVIAALADANKDRAEFALMTFGIAHPPEAANDVPEPCKRQPGNKEIRFTWVTTVNQPYSSIWKPVTNAFGEQGIWLLCGDNRPFPYLRHDDLGGFSLPNDSLEPLINEPLYVQHSTPAAYAGAGNYERKVQWFPRFMGRRINLDCSDDNQKAIALQTWGDYGNNNGLKNSQVCGRDFYYWPY